MFWVDGQSSSAKSFYDLYVGYSIIILDHIESVMRENGLNCSYLCFVIIDILLETLTVYS